MLQNARVTAFTVSEVLLENQKGKQVKLTTLPHPVYVLCVSLNFLFPLFGPFFTNWIPISNFAYIASSKSRVSSENISIKVSALKPIWALFTAIVLPIL